MAIDSSIYSQIQQPRPVNLLADYANLMQVQGAQQANKLNQLKFDAYQREQDDNTALRSALSAPGADPYNALLRMGRVKEATEYRKSETDAKQVNSNISKNDVETEHKTIGIYRDASQSITDPQSAVEFVRTMHSDPRLKNSAIARVPIEQALAQIPQDPAQLGAWKQQFALGATKFIEMNKPTFTTRNLGGTTDTLATEGLTGATRVVNSAQNSVSPDAQLSAQTARRGQDKADQRARDANELKRQEIAGNVGSGLPVLGVPQPTVVPWANQSNPKDANKVKAAEIARGSKEIEKDVDAARKEAQTAEAARRFLELNQGTETGGVTDRFAPTRWVQGMGADYSEMESITARLAPGMREPGSGSTSDFDGKQFERATVGVDKPRETNQNIAKAIMARSQQSQDYADFRQTYLEQNGTLQGADRYWKQYVNANPIFDPAKPGSYELNTKRKGWTEHFKGGGKAEANPPAPGAPARVSNDAEYNALPSGAVFVGPDGKQRRKP